MTREGLNRIRSSLQDRRDNLVEWFSTSPVSIRERVLGPLVDVPIVEEVDEALHHVEHEDLGRCTVCHDEVEPELLELDFTTCVCLTHYDEPQQRELERDLELAAQVQQHLFPCCTPALPGVDIAAHAVPARIVSGDYYDFFASRGEAQGMAIADVMGKGVSASMLMANLQASLRILAPQHDDLGTLATRLNELFVHNLKQIRFISLFLMALDTENCLFRYCNAGHNPPLLYRAASRSAEWLRPTGPAIGLMSDPPFREIEQYYEPGDVLVLYTDGLAEARNADEMEFGAAGLAAYVERHHDETADRLLNGLWQHVMNHTNGTRQDDTTVVVARFE